MLDVMLSSCSRVGPLKSITSNFRSLPSLGSVNCRSHRHLHKHDDTADLVGTSACISYIAMSICTHDVANVSTVDGSRTVCDEEVPCLMLVHRRRK